MTVNGTVSRNPKSGFSFSPSYSRNGREARVSRWYNLPERIAAVAERLRSVRIENRDALELLSFFRDRPATLVYLDPPYLIERDHGYVIDANDEEFHRSLLSRCVRSNAMILVSSYANELYDKYLSARDGWVRTEIKTHTRDTRGIDYERTEVLWKNSWYVASERSNSLLLRLSPKESAERKVNPTRKHRARPPLSAGTGQVPSVKSRSKDNS